MKWKDVGQGEIVYLPKLGFRVQKVFQPAERRYVALILGTQAGGQLKVTDEEEAMLDRRRNLVNPAQEGILAAREENRLRDHPTQRPIMVRRADLLAKILVGRKIQAWLEDGWDLNHDLMTLGIEIGHDHLEAVRREMMSIVKWYRSYEG